MFLSRTSFGVCLFFYAVFLVMGFRFGLVFRELQTGNNEEGRFPKAFVSFQLWVLFVYEFPRVQFSRHDVSCSVLGHPVRKTGTTANMDVLRWVDTKARFY